MRVEHVPAAGGDRWVLASEVSLADTFWEQTRGLMFRRSVPDDYALVFEFDATDSWLERRLPLLGGPSYQFIHMLFVFVALDVVWVVDEQVVKVETMYPFRSVGVAKADTIVEFPAGAASDVSVGDRLVVAEGERDSGGDGAAEPAAADRDRADVPE